MRKFDAFYKKNLIKLILKRNKFLGKLGLLPEKTNTFGKLEEITKKLSSSSIDIQLYEKDRENKEFIFDIVRILSEYGIKVELTEFDKIFNNEDLELIRENNADTTIDMQYMYPNYSGGINIETEININDYLRIMDKIKYLVKVSQNNFTQKDEQIMFIINQLSEYVEYDFEIDDKTREERNEISSLKGCLEDRKTVCAGVALAFELCMEELEIESMLICGYVGDKDKNELKKLDNNHVWNKIKLGEGWYNVDITYILPIPDCKVTKEERAEIFILASDKELEDRGHYITDFRGIPVSKNDYPEKMKIYKKTRDIGNVLEEYDKGKKKMFLSYKNKVEQNPNESIKMEQNEKGNSKKFPENREE